ncbi:MAG: hypothetical protein EP330_24415 [Deltaproteobacteria bacterium]|nr:MAG: hypothetical protein EP330_24415 [Deltaproteobacteria bacterium]
MSRLLPFIALFSLAACDGEITDTSSPTDPTVDFEIEIPNDGIDNDNDGTVDESGVDTGWPSYTGSRRRSLEAGWRHIDVPEQGRGL